MLVSHLISQISSTIIHLKNVFLVVTRGNPSLKSYFACIQKILFVQIPVLSSFSTQCSIISFNRFKYCFIKIFKKYYP
ncbi:MAG: hypothetical protein LBC61_04400 [Candidatus Peribacteria bacterium]|nr:hypothetical protein [Candidatus Peribacteria bacterium]